jgi:hypothetical protein
VYTLQCTTQVFKERKVLRKNDFHQQSALILKMDTVVRLSATFLFKQREVFVFKNLDAKFKKSETSFSFRILLQEDSFPLNFKKFNISQKHMRVLRGSISSKQNVPSSSLLM